MSSCGLINDKILKMDRIITDNSKVNENLLNEVNNVKKQNKELIVKNMDLQEQLLIQRVSQQRELLIAYELSEIENPNIREKVLAKQKVEKYISNL
mgnify:CR=1 FL=1|tara:strand:+ start:811 stop:1098 length:288 start_codon:yes stop_codon:yes gene_type:complete